MLSKLAIKRPVTTVMLLFIVILCGVVSLTGMKMDLMPSMDIPIAVVSTTYIGAGPEEIESLITKPVEEALGTVSNVDEITSTSSSGASMVMVQFEDGTDVDMAAIDMREKIDLIKGYLPDGANDPMVLKIDISALSSIILGVTSDMTSYELTELLNNKIVNRLERIEGIASVSLTGDEEREIQVVVNREKMEGYGVTMAQISNYLMAENINYPSGTVTDGVYKLQLRTVGEFESVDDIRALPIMTSTGAVIKLSDVADVAEAAKDNSTKAYINGGKGVILSISKQSNANIVDVSNEIEKELNKINNEYDELNIFMLSNTSSYIKTSVSNVLQTVFLSAAMAFIVLFLFLRNMKPSLIIIVSVPTSVFATFACMYLLDMNLNVISLGGISIGVGMLVDNSVVVLENIYRYRTLGYDAHDSAYLGTKEVSMSIFASTLTTVAVFIPLIFIKGIMGQVFKDLSLTVCIALIASLIVSLSFVPMACTKLLKGDIKEGEKKSNIFTKASDYVGRGVDSLDKIYKKALTWCLAHRKKTVIATLIIFIATLSLVPIIGFNLMPDMDQGEILINVELPTGSRVEETEDVTNTVLGRIGDIEEIDVDYVMIGGGTMSMFYGTDSDTASIYLNLVGKKDRSRTTNEIIADINDRVSSIPGAQISAETTDSAMGLFGGSALTFNITGNDNDELLRVSEEVKALVETIDGVSSVETSAGKTVPQANIVIDRTKASNYGITAASIGSAISNAVTGKVATSYKVDGTEIDVRIMNSGDSVERLNDIKSLTVTSATGVNVPLAEITDIVIEDGASSITRSNQTRYISISGEINNRDTSSVKKDIEALLGSYAFPDGMSYEFTGTMEMLTDTFTSLAKVFIVALLLVYMIMASQFESLKDPFIVMFSVPLAITGGILGMFITGNDISAVSFMGFIMLVGMVVNNAIVLIDYTIQLRNQGMECDEALIEAGPTRLRPILMTTLTTVLGLLPSAIMTVEGLEMQKPLSITIIFGMMISTLVTLVFVPVLYSLMNNKKGKEIKNIPAAEQ